MIGRRLADPLAGANRAFLRDRDSHMKASAALALKPPANVPKLLPHGGAWSRCSACGLFLLVRDHPDDKPGQPCPRCWTRLTGKAMRS